MVSLSQLSGAPDSLEGVLPVSRSASRVAAALVQCPLGSAADVAPMVGTKVAGVYARLRELRSAGMADGVSLGWSIANHSVGGSPTTPSRRRGSWAPAGMRNGAGPGCSSGCPWLSGSTGPRAPSPARGGSGFSSGYRVSAGRCGQL